MLFYRTGVMKYILAILLLCLGTNVKRAYSTDKYYEIAIFDFIGLQQQEPFYFVTPVPPAKRLLDNIDLSFFKNRLSVATYRYRIQIPNGAETSIDRRLTVWSGWTKNDLAEIKIPRLDLEGGYKLIVEYNPSEGTGIKRFEVPFYVYYSSSANVASDTKTLSAPPARSTSRESNSSRESANAALKTSDERGSQNQNERAASVLAVTATGKTRKETSVKRDTLNDLSGVRIDINFTPEIIPDKFLLAELADELQIPETGGEENLDSIYMATVVKDPVLYNDSVQGGTTADAAESFDSVSVNQYSVRTSSDSLSAEMEENVLTPDNNEPAVNDSLHLAILSGDEQYAKYLISGGADLNVRNNLDLTPLHIAVLMNNRELVNELIDKGADLNASGNTGYTALHIASELNLFDISADLIFHGANTKLKTSQGLSPKLIARIQGNTEIEDLISGKDSSLLLHRPVSANDLFVSRSKMMAPDINFVLPYDKTLVQKRHFNKLIQYISVPVFTVSSVLFATNKSKANHNFSMSRVAETEAMAKELFDDGVRYNRIANITGGISLISAFGIVHSTMRKRNITSRMTKTF
jgi:hypothetical protein